MFMGRSEQQFQASGTGIAGLQPATELEADQQLSAAWQDALLEALSSNASRQALAAAPAGSPILELQAELQETEGEYMCQSASDPFVYRAFSTAPPPYAPCLCGNTSDPFLWFYAAHAQQLINAANTAFNAILGTLKDDGGSSLAAQVLQGEGKPEPEGTEGQAGGRRLQKVSFKCGNPFVDLIREPSPDAFIAFILAATATEGKCELCFPLRPPLMACVSLATDVETAKQAVAVAQGQIPLTGFEHSTGDTCANDPLAGRSAADIRKEVEAMNVKLGLKICIDVKLADPNDEWGTAVRLMGTQVAQGFSKEYDKQACFASAGATWRPAIQKLELDIDATIRGTAMIKLAATEDTPACQWAARSRALYEAVACREYCRYKPGVWQRLRIGLVFNLAGLMATPLKMTYINIKAPLPPCLKPGCPGQEQAVDPDPGTGCTPTTFQKENEFYWPPYGTLPCSLATTVDSGYLAELKNVPTVVDCCKACTTTGGCTAYNYCAEEDGCGLPGIVGGTDGSHCYLYSVDSALSWSKHLIGGGCGNDFMGTWWSGMTAAKTPLTKACPAAAVWRHDELFMPGASLCSLGTLWNFDGVAYQLTSALECCAACASREGCTAWNWCDGNGCFIPGAAAFDVGAQKGDCFLYSGISYTYWQSYRQSKMGCGAAEGWWTGHMDAGTPTQPDVGTPFVTQRCHGAEQDPAQCPPLDYQQCCACRRINRGVDYTSLWGSAGDYSTNTFGSEPDCGSRLLSVPGGLIVDYTGAKVFGFERNYCPTADYAEVVVDHHGTAYTGWVAARDVVFCAERKCGTAVELGAGCGGTTHCCHLPEEGGHEHAACVQAAASFFSGPKTTNSVCRVPNLEETSGQEYVISVKTADEPDAGTDAQIFVQLKGEFPPEEGSFWANKIESQFFLLDNPDKDDFQQGEVSEFKVFTEEMPVVTEVDLMYHKAGWLPAWKPEWVALRWPNGTSVTFTRQPDWQTGSVPNGGWVQEDGLLMFTPTKTSSAP
ncbi:lipoxygenase homology domain-containing 1 isoform X2 isoform B [Chlorella sorokiniana]|uniref:Lipoxygenase homology domain-containing 1 isoform X2 isoform B n=1 Tax=Chlorella sorokiniana TaxID=3076 RepID=A0A2P6TF11_CHLSO|nr:lipoxygenase homology domain-containing 1 isoform X2 isoform B [Chlorella sorokiniana]|eukprot:PRW32564.1 lipoxygenase homology domain-containing 1 isoform X2 isoform B [Chlorella sorokiniana]